MTLFYIPNPTQNLTLTTTLLIIDKQPIRSFIKAKVIVNGLLIVRIGTLNKVWPQSLANH